MWLGGERLSSAKVTFWAALRRPGPVLDSKFTMGEQEIPQVDPSG